jgi:hypothetical protein
MSRLGAPVVLCISGLLLLAACGSSESEVADATRPTPGTTSIPAPAAGASPEAVRIGPYTQVFATPLPADPAQAQVMTGFRQAQVLWNKSNIAWHLVAPVRDYVTGDALTHLIVAMTGNRQRGLVPAGTDRFFMTRISGVTGRSATVLTCDDSSKFKEENPRTGAVNAAFVPPPNQAYLFETWHMVQLSGHWAISSFSVATLPNPSALPCQP